MIQPAAGEVGRWGDDNRTVWPMGIWGWNCGSDLRLAMLITAICPVQIGGYSRQALAHTVLGNWTVHHAAEGDKTIGNQRKMLVPAVEILFPQPRAGDWMCEKNTPNRYILHSTTIAAECELMSFGTVYPWEESPSPRNAVPKPKSCLFVMLSWICHCQGIRTRVIRTLCRPGSSAADQRRPSNASTVKKAADSSSVNTDKVNASF